jgi:hypothetical protein
MDRDIASETRRSAELHSLLRRPAPSARPPSVAAARHAREGSVVGLLLPFGACVASWAVLLSLSRPLLIIIVAEVT